MYDLSACVVCFNTDVKLINLNSGQLRREFHLISGIQTCPGDGMPDHLCFQCTAIVRNYKRFRDRCHRSHYALKEILRKNNEINVSNLKDLNRELLGIMPQLSYMNLDRTRYEQVKFQWKKHNRIDWCNSSAHNIPVVHCSTLTPNDTFNEITNTEDLEFTEQNIKTDIDEIDHYEVPIENDITKDEPSYICDRTKETEIPNSFMDHDMYESGNDQDADTATNLELKVENTEGEADGVEMDEEYASLVPISVKEATAAMEVYKMFSQGKYQCEICNKAYNNEERMKVHLRMHDKNRENEYLLPTLVESLAADSGSEIDEWEDYEDIHQILEVNLEEEIAAEDVEMHQADQNVPGNELTWSENFESFTGVEETYLVRPGPTIRETSPITIFKSIWDWHIMEIIVEQTNKYAWEIIARASGIENTITKGSRLNDWHETTVEEMYKFFSILIYMSLCNRGRLDEYWTTGVLGMPCFRKIMSKNRFLLLLRFIHFVENDGLTDGIHGYERKIYKVAPIVEHCNKKFAEIYIPRRPLSIDESLLLWEGHLSWRQCTRTKAANFGIKMYELCEAETGYLLKLMIHAGKNHNTGHGSTDVPSKVILKLCEDYLEKGHCLYMNNFYTSVGLARFLKYKHTDVVGNLNRHSVETPSNIRNINEQQMQLGDSVAAHCGDVAVLAWKNVTLASTFHKNETVPGSRASIHSDKPHIVHDYNKYMGGSKKDQKLSMYSLEHKRGLKWYIKVFSRLLNYSILNSYIVYKCHEGVPKMDHRQFRYVLAEALSLQSVNIQRIRPAASTVTNRYSGNHFPAHFSDDSSTVRTNKRMNRHKRARCVHCSANKRRTETNVMCTGCNIFLCVGSCWHEYHTPPTE